MNQTTYATTKTITRKYSVMLYNLNTGSIKFVRVTAANDYQAECAAAKQYPNWEVMRIEEYQ